MSSEPIDLGNGTTAELTTVLGDPEQKSWGLIWRHHNRQHPEQACVGSISWHPDTVERYRWQLVSLSPLHVEPSLLCACGAHIFIRDGRAQEV